jgi:hypothetical protein
LVHYLVIRIQHPGNNVRDKKVQKLISLLPSISLAMNITIQGGERANLTDLAEKLQEVMERVQPLRG